MSSEIEEIKAKIDIAELVGEYVAQCRPAMVAFTALCPSTMRRRRRSW